MLIAAEQRRLCVRPTAQELNSDYQELVKTADANGKAGNVKWNFEKFLISPDGTVHRFRPTTEPDAPEVIAAIEESLPA